MGKRKSSKKPVVRKQNEPLCKKDAVVGLTPAKEFKCLFCHHEKSVNVKIDKQGMFGNLNCKICGQKFTTPINNLSVPVDVYCDWVDACEEARAKAPAKKAKAPKPRSPSPQRAVAASAALEEDYDDEDDDEEDLAEALRKRKAPRDAYDDDEDDNHRSKAARRAYESDEDDDE